MTGASLALISFLRTLDPERHPAVRRARTAALFVGPVLAISAARSHVRGRLAKPLRHPAMARAGSLLRVGLRPGAVTASRRRLLGHSHLVLRLCCGGFPLLGAES